jgi:hypothetical protein
MGVEVCKKKISSTKTNDYGYIVENYLHRKAKL